MNKMNKITQVIEGLKIVQETSDKSISIYDNTLYAGRLSTMTVSERTIMKDLGWEEHKIYDCFFILIN